MYATVPATWSMAPIVPCAGVAAIERRTVSPFGSAQPIGTALAVPATTVTDDALQTGGTSRWRVVTRVRPPA